MSENKRGIFGWLLAAAVAIGGNAAAHGQERRPGGPRQEVAGVFKAVDANAITIAVTAGDGRRDGREPPVVKEETFALAKNVEAAVAVGGNFSGGGRGAGSFFKEVKLADLTPGVRVSLMLSDQKAVESVIAEGPTVRGQLKAVDATKNSVTIQLPSQGERARDGTAPPAGEEKTYNLAPDAEIAVDDGRGGRFSLKEAKLTDLAHGAVVTARLSVNAKQILFIQTEGPAHQGLVKAIDPAKKSLTLVIRPARGDDGGEEQTLTVSTDAVILLDDGRGRRLSLKQAKLTDVPVGAMAAVKLSADLVFVTLLRVEGPTLTGQLTAIDANKGVLVLAIPKGRGEAPDEKSLTLAKDAHVSIDGVDSTLANLKVGENSPPVVLRLSLDQKTVLAVSARAAGGR